MPSFWQAELLKEGNLGLLSWGWVNRGLDRLAGRLSPVSCGFGWARPCYALFPLCSASPASHCALATADLGLAGRTSDQLPGNNFHHRLISQFVVSQCGIHLSESIVSLCSHVTIHSSLTYIWKRTSWGRGTLRHMIIVGWITQAFSCNSEWFFWH